MGAGRSSPGGLPAPSALSAVFCCKPEAALLSPERSPSCAALGWEQTLPTGMGRDGASDLPAVWQLLLRRCFSVALDGTGTALLAAGRTLLTMNSHHVWSSESGWQ